MKLLFFLSILLLPVFSLAQQGGSFQYLNLIPTTLPSVCTPGLMRNSVVSGSTILSLCETKNKWSQVTTSVPSGGTISNVLIGQGLSNPPVFGINAPLASNISGTIGFSQLPTISAYSVLNNNNSFTSSVSAGQSIIMGTPSIVDTGIAFQTTGNMNSYFQHILQNTNSGSSASADFVANNNLGTASTFYVDLGINSSGFTGTGSLNLPNASYVYSNSGDMVLGTNTLNNIHLVVNSGATDALIVNTSNKLIFPGMTGYLYGNGSNPITSSTTIPSTAMTGVETVAQGGTNSGSALLNNHLIVSSGGTIGEIPTGATVGYVLTATGNTSLPVFAPSSVTGTLAVTNGGTGTNHALFNNRVMVSSGGTIGEFSPGNSGQFLESQGIGVAPIWGSALSNPMTTTGDIIYSSTGTGTPSRLAIGSGNSVLTVVSGIPAWGNGVTGIVVAAHVANFSGQWTNTSASYAAFASNVSATANVLDVSNNTFGIPQTSNSNLPEITVNSLAAGVYKVTAIFTGNNTSGVFAGYAINDGTNTRGNVTFLSPVPATGDPAFNVQAVFSYSTSANRTFIMWGFANAGTTEIDMTDTNAQFNWIVEKLQ